MRHKARATVASGRKPPEFGCAAAEADPVVIVRVVAAAPPAGVTVAGLKAQLAPAGRPEHAKVTAELNPFVGVTVTVTVPWPPGCNLSVPAVEVSEKLDPRAAFTICFTASEVLDWKFESPL